MVINEASDLRQDLSDELHARAFYDFEGAGRFIRFVYLVGNDDSALLDYVNDYLQTFDSRPMQTTEKFYRMELDGFALRVERHLVTISFVEKGLKVRSVSQRMHFERFAAYALYGHGHAPVTVFNAIWVEVGGQPPALQQFDMLKTLNCRAVASNNFSDAVAQVHFAFDIDAAGYSRVVVFNKSIEATRMGRMVQRIVEVETYRLLSLLGLATVKAHSARLTHIEEVLNGLTNVLAKEIKKPDGQVQQLLTVLSSGCRRRRYLFAHILSCRPPGIPWYVDRPVGAYAANQIVWVSRCTGFLDRRMTPAMDGYAAFSERLASLSQRINRERLAANAN